MSKQRSPLSLARRWTAGALFATTLGAGVVGVHLASDQGRATASGTITGTGSTGAGTTSAGTTSSGDDGSSSGDDGTTSNTTSNSTSGFGSVSGVTPGSSAPQTSTSGS